MILLLLLFFELILLYFLSRWLTHSLFRLFMIVFRHRSIAVTVMLILQFPGTVIHELAHLFTAEILRVPTGKLTLVPESIREENIKSGSVAIAETDPFRRYAIGLAPIFTGLLVVTAIAYFLPQVSDWLYLVLIYLLLTVSNTMFPSPEDVKGFVPFIIVLGLFIGAGLLMGLRLSLTGQTLEIATRILSTLTDSLGVVLLVNTVLLIASRSISLIFSGIFRIRK